MPILFSAVAYTRRILAKYACCDGNFTEIVDEVLSKIPSENHKLTYSHGHYLLHYIVDDQHFYFCITDKTCQRSRAFLFLNEVKRRFSRNEKSFNQVLAKEMHRYSEDYSTITIRKGELDELNSIGVGCSENILGGKILFVNNPQEITYSTVSYVGQSPQKIFTYESMSAESRCDRDVSCRFYLVILSMVLVLMSLVVSTVGSGSFVVVACVFFWSVARYAKGKSS